MHRDDDTRGSSSTSRETLTGDTWALSVFSEDWGLEYAGAFCIGPLKDIKLLDAFCSEHGFASRRAILLPKGKVWMTLRHLFKDRPRGYLVNALPSAESGVRLLRLTQVSNLGGNILFYAASTPQGDVAYWRAPQTVDEDPSLDWMTTDL
jgi:hypothetical protein